MTQIKSLLITLGFLVSASLFSQNYYHQGFTFKVGSSYGLGLPGSQPFDSFKDITFTDTTSTESLRNYSFGSGGWAHLGIGYQVDDIYRIGLELSYQFYNRGVATETYNSIFGGQAFSVINEDTYTSYAIMATPEITFMIPNNSVARPFVRFGIPIGYHIISERLEDGDFNTTSVLETNYTGNISIGFAGALGVEWELSDNVFFYTELRTLNSQIATRRSEVVYYELDGVASTGQLNTNQKEVEYVSEISSLDPARAANEPRTELRRKANFNHFALSLGFVFQLF